MREQAKDVQFVPARIVARFGMTTTRARELAQLLTSQLAAYDARKDRQGAPSADE